MDQFCNPGTLLYPKIVAPERPLKLGRFRNITSLQDLIWVELSILDVDMLVHYQYDKKIEKKIAQFSEM